MSLERFGDLLIDPSDVKAVSVIACAHEDDEEEYKPARETELALILLKDGTRMEAKANDARLLMAALNNSGPVGRRKPAESWQGGEE